MEDIQKYPKKVLVLEFAFKAPLKDHQNFLGGGQSMITVIRKGDCPLITVDYTEGVGV